MSVLKDFLNEAAASLLPVVLVVLVLSFTIVGYPLYEIAKFIVSAILVYVGLIFFLIGARASLIPMGKMLGSLLPRLGTLPRILVVTFVLGWLMTAAEPDLWVYSRLVDSASGGVVSHRTLTWVVAFGVGLVLAYAILRLAKSYSIKMMFAVGYGLATIMVIFAPSAFVSYAFDSSAVTTGPVTVPFVLALGVGASEVLTSGRNLSDSFGLIGASSLGPVLTVLVMGLMRL